MKSKDVCNNFSYYWQNYVWKFHSYLFVKFQYLAVQLMWVTLHLFMWKGPATQLVDIFKREDAVLEKDFSPNVDLSKITTFFMNPQTVARNLLVCTSFVRYLLHFIALLYLCSSSWSPPPFGSCPPCCGRSPCWSRIAKLTPWTVLLTPCSVPRKECQV